MQVAIGCMHYDAVYIKFTNLHDDAVCELFRDAHIGSKSVKTGRGG